MNFERDNRNGVVPQPEKNGTPSAPGTHPVLLIMIEARGFRRFLAKGTSRDRPECGDAGALSDRDMTGV